MKGLETARAQGAATLLFGGGAPAADHADVALVVPSDDTARVQEMHVLLLHIVLDEVDRWAAAVVKRGVLHMIGNAHIDPVWLWQWPEGYQEVRATFAAALDRMDETPDFVFTHTSVLFLQWVEESDPQMFARIRERVAEGRWQIVGGWWIEPDCNIPSGESFVRQGLYGQRYLLDRFGITATTGANLDSFGHNASLPQILRRSGMDSYVFLRPKPDENADLPGPLFRWTAADGSQVLAYRIPHEYCAPRDDLGDHVERSLATLPDELGEAAVFYGVGNHGGGPTRANLRSIDELRERDGLTLELSSLRRFFDAVEHEDLPAWRGDLQYHAPGCYTTHSGIKRWNRRAENLLQRAEKWSVVADALGAQSYPLRDLSDAWQLLLFNQFHDTLAGTSIEPAYEDARDQIGHATSLAALAFNRAVQSIARQIAIPYEEGTFPLVVFNAAPVAAARRRRARVQLAEARGSAPRRRGRERRPAAADAFADDDERQSRPARVPGRRAAARLPGLQARPGCGGERRRRGHGDRDVDRERARAARARSGVRSDRAARAQGDRARPRRAAAGTRKRGARPVRHVGARDNVLRRRPR